MLLLSLLLLLLLFIKIIIIITIIIYIYIYLYDMYIYIYIYIYIHLFDSLLVKTPSKKYLIESPPESQLQRLRSSPAVHVVQVSDEEPAIESMGGGSTLLR